MVSISLGVSGSTLPPVLATNKLMFGRTCTVPERRTNHWRGRCRGRANMRTGQVHSCQPQQHAKRRSGDRSQHGRGQAVRRAEWTVACHRESLRDRRQAATGAPHCTVSAAAGRGAGPGSLPRLRRRSPFIGGDAPTCSCPCRINGSDGRDAPRNATYPSWFSVWTQLKLSPAR